ncbi:MAG: ATP-binding protein [Rhizobiaceae bacterium]
MRLSLPKLSFSDMTTPWVHASVPSGGDEIREHARFISINVVFGMIGLSLIPLVLAIKERASGLDLIVFTLLASPLMLAALVSRTGSIDWGKRISLFCLTILLAIVVASVGGLATAYVLLFSLLPFEAIMWRCKSPLKLSAVLVACGAVATVLIGINSASAVAGLAAYAAAFELPWLAVAGLAYSMFTACRIQQRLAANSQELQREARRLEVFSRHSSELITRHGANGSTLFASPASRELLGVASTDLLDGGLINRVHIQDRVLLLKALSDSIQLKQVQLKRIRVRVSGNDGRLWKQVEVKCRAHKDEQSGKMEAICTMHDVSLLHELEENLQKAEQSAGQFNDAQRRFLATMSHELRTPLNAIVGFSDILHQELFGALSQQKHREYVALIQDSGRHLLNVVNDMLDMSRIEAGKYELSVSNFSFSDIVDATTAMLQPLAIKGGVNVKTSIDASLPEMSADKRACQQILINILSNAIKFTPEGGNVLLSAKQFGRSLRIRLTDEGIGIDKEFLGTIGQPFTQAESGNDRRFEGSGIGLSVVKGLVALHSGEFQIKSKVGVGTTVTVTIPLAVAGNLAASRPVPTDSNSQLVHLGSTQLAKPTQTTAPQYSKGDRHARVSA